MKLIHCADLHLDSSMQMHLTAQQASVRNTELIRSFVRLTQYAEENGVRAVIVAGDLFDASRVRERTVDEVVEAMRRTPGVDYLYLPGNHDEAAHAFRDRVLPENLKEFTDSWKTFFYDDVAVSGIAPDFCDSSFYEALPQADERTHIVTLHGQVGSVCAEDQINLNLLKNRGISYLALGHIHSFSLQKLDDKGVYCYAGCLEGRGFDECGSKGFVILEIEHGKVTPDFVPFACRELHRVPVDITGLARSTEIAQRMKEAAQEIPARDMVEFLLTGYSAPDTNLSVSYLQTLFQDSFFFTKVKDESRMALNPADYENDVSLKGEFIRQVMASELEETDKEAVIRMGLQALAGEEIAQ